MANDWKRERAIFEQKIDLFEKEIAESKTREENLRNMNENIMSALADLTNDKKYFLVKMKKNFECVFS